MATQSSSHPIICASFNQDNSCFAIGTRDGFKIFDCNTGKLLYEQVIGAFVIVEMLYRSSLLAIVGAGEQPSLSPRRLCLFNTVSGTAFRELNFLTSILAVRVSRKRLIVVLQEQAYIYDANSLEIKRIIDTVPNLKGLSAFSANSENPYLALPASLMKGSVLVYNVIDLQSHCEIHAHRSPLAALAFSSNGMYIATASEQGTIIRVHLISEATKVTRHNKRQKQEPVQWRFCGSCSCLSEFFDILPKYRSTTQVVAHPLKFTHYVSELIVCVTLFVAACISSRLDSYNWKDTQLTCRCKHTSHATLLHYLVTNNKKSPGLFRCVMWRRCVLPKKGKMFTRKGVQ